MDVEAQDDGVLAKILVRRPFYFSRPPLPRTHIFDISVDE